MFGAARAEGISQKQLRAAKKKLRAVSRKAGFGDGWEWYLPGEDAQAALEDAQDSLPGEQGTFGHLGESSATDVKWLVIWEDVIDSEILDF